MRKRTLGATGLEVSEMALGTWGLSGDAYGPVEDSEVDRVIDRAVQLGITLFDTAPSYGEGQMERKLGKRIPHKTTKVITKLGTDLSDGYPQKNFEKAYLREAFERSQERLRRNAVDVVLLHNPSMFTMKRDEPFECMHDLKGRGQLVAWGVSAGSVDVAQKAIERGADVVMLAYNVFLTRDLLELTDVVCPPVEDSGDTADGAADGAPTDKEDDADEEESASKKDDEEEAETKFGPPICAIIARSVLAHGLLSGHWSTEREFYEGDHRAERWNGDELRRRVGQLNALRPLLTGDVKTMRAAALRYVLSNPLVSSAVLGPRRFAQLDQLVREAGSGPTYLGDTQVIQLVRRLQALGVAV